MWGGKRKDTAAPSKPSWEDVAKQADALKEKDDVSGNYAILDAAFERGERHAEILWRLGRACYDMGEESTDPQVRMRHFERGLGLANESIQQNPQSFAAQKWKGVLLGSYGDYIPTKQKIANAYTIREHFAKAVELNPQDSTSHYCLAKWCWSMIQISWIERQAANVLFGAPPKCTLDEAKDSLLKSQAIDDAVYTDALLGDVFSAEKKFGDAAKWYKMAAACPAVTESQKRQQAEAAKKAEEAAKKATSQK
jgi:hypothetical protein